MEKIDNFESNKIDDDFGFLIDYGTISNNNFNSDKAFLISKCFTASDMIEKGNIIDAQKILSELDKINNN